MAFTGRTKQMFSPLAGRTLAYLESYTIRVTPSRGAIPDIEGIKATLNSQFASGVPESNNMPIDAQCDSILFIQGAVTDQYKYRTWIAETQPAGLNGNRLIADWIIAAIIIGILISVSLAVVLFYSAFMAIVTPLIPSKPKYVGGTPDNPTQYDDFAQYLSGQNLLYWYVCPYCGAGFGLKSSYPNIADVPVEEKAAFDEHKANCKGIPKTNYDIMPLLVWGIVGMGAVVFIVYSIPKIIIGRK